MVGEASGHRDGANVDAKVIVAADIGRKLEFGQLKRGVRAL